MNFKHYRSLILSVTVSIVSFTLALIVRNAGDLTIYTGAQLLKAHTMIALLAIGIYYTFDNYQLLKQKFFYYLAVNGAAIPLLMLSRYPYSISLSLISAGFAVLIVSAPGIVDRVWNRFKLRNEVTPPPIAKSLKPITLAVSGVDSALGEELLLQLLNHHTVKQLILFGRNLANLESWRYWLREHHPDVAVVTALSEHVNATTLASLFKSYRPELVFDIDRLFFSGKSEGTVAAVATTNLYWPRLLIEEAIKIKAKAVVTLSPHAHKPDELIESCQLVHECFAQKMDGAQTRVIPLRCSPAIEDRNTLYYLARFLKKQESKEIMLSEAKTIANIIQVILNQLLANPAHHGSLWAVTTVKKFQSSKIGELNSTGLTLNQFYKLVAELINSQKPVTHFNSEWLQLSLAGAAIVNDCPIIEFEDYFMALNQAIVDKNELEINNILKVA